MFFHKLYIHPNKIPKTKLSLLKKNYARNGGVIVDDEKDADLVLTVVDYPTKKPKVNPDWISNSILVKMIY
jgi:hypothetical protein